MRIIVKAKRNIQSIFSSSPLNCKDQLHLSDINFVVWRSDDVTRGF